MGVAAVVAVTLLIVVAVFQIGLAVGAPWGAAAWGGKFQGVLPVGLRVASGVVGILIYPLFALFVLTSADLIDVAWMPSGPPGMWIVAAVFMLGALANFASRSKVERAWGPVALGIAICSGIIALAL
jgi:hypothetical protein